MPEKKIGELLLWGPRSKMQPKTQNGGIGFPRHRSLGKVPGTFPERSWNRARPEYQKMKIQTELTKKEYYSYQPVKEFTTKSGKKKHYQLR